MTDEMIGIIFLITLAIGTGAMLLDTLGLIDMSRKPVFVLSMAAIITICLMKGWCSI